MLLPVAFSLQVSFLFVSVVLASETVEEAAKLARDLVDNSFNAIGVIATTYPAEHLELPGHPFALQEYYASCFNNGSLALLMFPISQSTKNIYDSSNPNNSATLTVQSEHPSAARPRVALMGQVNRVSEDLFESQGIEACYIASHPDTAGWVPSRWGYHASFWARFDPQSIYYVGGFGGLHYIGNIPIELYQQSKSIVLYPSRGKNQEYRPPGAAYDQMPILPSSQEQGD